MDQVTSESVARQRAGRRRKPTAERRAEIVTAACEIALADGLVAEAFADVMTRDRDLTFAMIEAAAPGILDQFRAAGRPAAGRALVQGHVVAASPS